MFTRKMHNRDFEYTDRVKQNPVMICNVAAVTWTTLSVRCNCGGLISVRPSGRQLRLLESSVEIRINKTMITRLLCCLPTLIPMQGPANNLDYQATVHTRPTHLFCWWLPLTIDSKVLMLADGLRLCREAQSTLNPRALRAEFVGATPVAG